MSFRSTMNSLWQILAWCVLFALLQQARADTAFQRNNPAITATCGIPIGLAASGTMGANGALTLGTATVLTYSSGIWWHFPAGAVFSGSAAGFYWTVMSSTTAGTVYNSTYTPGTSAFCKVGVTTAVSDAGPGAYTGSTSEINLTFVDIPGGTLGPNGRVRIDSLWMHTNSANNKTERVRYSGGAGTQYLNTVVTTTVSTPTVHYIRNRGATNAQIGGHSGNGPYGVSANTPVTSAVDTTALTQVVLTGQKANATDNIVLEAVTGDAWYAP